MKLPCWLGLCILALNAKKAFLMSDFSIMPDGHHYVFHEDEVLYMEALLRCQQDSGYLFNADFSTMGSPEYNGVTEELLENGNLRGIKIWANITTDSGGMLNCFILDPDLTECPASAAQDQTYGFICEFNHICDLPRESSPCENDGRCLSNTVMEQNFTCNCTGTGHTGTFCQIEINECMMNPCMFGECVDRIAFYECVCDVGYEGTNCSIISHQADSLLNLNTGVAISILTLVGVLCVLLMILGPYLYFSIKKRNDMKRTLAELAAYTELDDVDLQPIVDFKNLETSATTSRNHESGDDGLLTVGPTVNAIKRLPNNSGAPWAYPAVCDMDGQSQTYASAEVTSCLSNSSMYDALMRANDPVFAQLFKYPLIYQIDAGTGQVTTIKIDTQSLRSHMSSEHQAFSMNSDGTNESHPNGTMSTETSAASSPGAATAADVASKPAGESSAGFGLPATPTELTGTESGAVKNSASASQKTADATNAQAVQSASNSPGSDPIRRAFSGKQTTNRNTADGTTAGQGTTDEVDRNPETTHKSTTGASISYPTISSPKTFVKNPRLTELLLRQTILENLPNAHQSSSNKTTLTGVLTADQKTAADISTADFQITDQTAMRTAAATDTNTPPSQKLIEPATATSKAVSQKTNLLDSLAQALTRQKTVAAPKVGGRGSGSKVPSTRNVAQINAADAYSKLTDTRPAYPKPAEAKPVYPESLKTRPAYPKPTDQRSADTRGKEATPAETTSVKPLDTDANTAKPTTEEQRKKLMAKQPSSEAQANSAASSDVEARQQSVQDSAESSLDECALARQFSSNKLDL